MNYETLLLVVVVFDRVCASTAMGFGRKVGEGGVSRWLLLLAGVLLAVATTATAADAVEEGEGAIAGEDTFRGSRRICEIKCQHHHNPVNRKRWIDYCIRYQLALGDVSSRKSGEEVMLWRSENPIRTHMCW
uniref:Uncharacterized protein n=1 Tax=Setaria viridis TaxID=4556 RepID=A0A4U6TUH4_SETVI|nr:hypothetical protein SEVIR_8G173200v2 [Setaria viridis]